MFIKSGPTDASDVLRMLHAKDWRSINHNQIVSLVNHLSKIDKDVAIECIRQLPNFMANSTDIISELGKRLDTVLKVNKDLAMESVKAHNEVLDALRWRLENESLDEETKDSIIQDMINEAYAIDEIVRKAKDSNVSLFKQVAGMGAAVMTLGITMLSGEDTLKNILNLPNKLIKK